MSQILKLLCTRAVADICRVQKGGPILNGYGLDPSVLQKGNSAQLCANRQGQQQSVQIEKIYSSEMSYILETWKPTLKGRK
jgi:hypothetical protein